MDEPADTVFDPRQILLVLADHGVEFVVVGGVAVQAHGHGRATRDLDLIPRPGLPNLSRLGEALSALEARPLRADRQVDASDPRLIEGAPLVPLITARGRLDLLNVAMTAGAPRSWEVLRSRAIEAEIDGRIIPVAGLDDLVRMKRAAGRDVDLQDIGALTRSDEELDVEAGEAT